MAELNVIDRALDGDSAPVVRFRPLSHLLTGPIIGPVSGDYLFFFL